MSQSIKKYINLSIILGLLMLFFVEEAIAQYDTGNLQKYWYYRHRLVNYFTQVGPGDGESLIIDSRNKGVFGDITSSEVNFGDQVIYLGRYIGILATEYKLLDDNGQDVSQTAKELFYAMDAFNRLDLNAETLKYNIDPVLDGFFIREDVPVDFITNPSPLNKDLPEPPPDENYHTGSGKPMWVNSIENAGQYHDMSQDQVYGMMVGLALVSKLVPDDDTYNGKPFQDGHTKFVDEAVWITDRMIDYIRSTNWIIRDPNGDKVGSGPDAFYFSFGTAIAAAKIVNNPIISFGYLDNVSGSPLAENVWQTMQQLGLLINLCDWAEFYNTAEMFEDLLNTIPGSPGNINITQDIYCHDFNLQMMLEIAAIGNSWHNGWVNTTQPSILILGNYFDWGSFFSLLRQVLHGGVYLFQPSTTESQLNSAPCDGPFIHSTSDKGANGWAYKRKYAGTIDEQYNNGQGFAANFSGVDYMLLHNMYYIQRLGKNGKDSDGNFLPMYNNMIDMEIAIDFPFGPGLGSKTVPWTIGAFRSITADNTIKAGGTPITDGDVTYRAGEEITLKPGFEVEAGAEFHAYIDPFVCVGGNYQKTGDSTGNQYGMPDPLPQPNNYVPLDYEEETIAFEEEETSETLAVEAGISIHPNPTSGEFQLTIGSRQEAKVYIYDIFGRLIEQLTMGNDQLTIDISKHPKGIYLVKVLSGEKVYIKKLIHQ